MSLGLSHSLSRHKLKFSPDKVDTMIVQAISLLDDIDKELNTYAMRLREWYGWSYPELAKIVNDNLAYARVVLKMGMRTNASKSDLSEILPEEIEGAVKAAAEISMGTEISTEDLENIQCLAEQVVSFSEYRIQLSGYLSARMQAIAPNLTSLVGDLVGARLIAHSGSLMNLAKSPASTIQILGAEKALFRALKTKHDTPKYGLIYHSSLIGQATGKNKGKMARMLATKTALGLRVDALADWGEEGEDGEEVTEEQKSMLGVLNREKLERRLAGLEGRPLRARGVGIGPSSNSTQPGKWEVKEARKYNHDADGLTGDEPAAAAPSKKLIEEVSDEPAAKKQKIAKSNGLKVIEAVVKDALEEDLSDDDEDSDDEMNDAAEEEGDEPQIAEAVKTNGTKHEDRDDVSVTLSDVSADTPDSPASPTQQEINWQSQIEGNTKVAKKARKKERHARKLILGDDRAKNREKEKERLERRLGRQKRRIAKENQVNKRAEDEDAKYLVPAKAAGLSVARYKRKLERGEITFDKQGKPVAISKKDLKKEKRKAEKAERLEGEGKKRKRDDDEPEAKPEKKKKKKDKALKA